MMWVPFGLARASVVENVKFTRDYDTKHNDSCSNQTQDFLKAGDQHS